MGCLMRLVQGACSSRTTPLASSYTASSRPTHMRMHIGTHLTQGTSNETGVQAAAMIPLKVGNVLLFWLLGQYELCGLCQYYWWRAGVPLIMRPSQSPWLSTFSSSSLKTAVAGEQAVPTPQRPMTVRMRSGKMKMIRGARKQTLCKPSTLQSR